MVQLFPILMISLLLIGDASIPVDPNAEAPAFGFAALIAWGPVLAMLGASWAVLAMCNRRLARGRTDALALSDRVMRLGGLGLLAAFASAIFAGHWLHAVRGVIGDLVFLDELLTLTPPLVGMVALWWLYYPIEKRVRDAVLVRRLDLGEAVYPVPSRGRYVLQQARMHLLLLLLPMLAILAVSECVRSAAYGWFSLDEPTWVEDALVFGSGVCVFIIAPVLIRQVLSTTPLARGEIRDDLEAICVRHKVKVRQFLVWNTDGAVLNAAVMGVFGWVRFVLMTDGLLESLPKPHIQAVMAHEIGHVRRHHMPWLVGSLMAVLPIAVVVVTLIAELVRRLMHIELDPPPTWLEGAVTGTAMVLALLVFGWVSRRFERQADTFAVQHLSELEHERPPAEDEVPADHDDDPKVTVRAVLAMHNALEYVARLNGVRPGRPSWRHGSIAWRQHYLTSLIGQPVRSMAIDRLVLRIRIMTVLMIVTAPGLVLLLEWILQ